FLPESSHRRRQNVAGDASARLDSQHNTGKAERYGTGSLGRAERSDLQGHVEGIARPESFLPLFAGTRRQPPRGGLGKARDQPADADAVEFDAERAAHQAGGGESRNEGSTQDVSGQRR